MIRKASKPLIQTNPYLQNPKERQSQFVNGVISSTSIEGVVVTRSQLKKTTKSAAKRK